MNYKIGQRVRLTVAHRYPELRGLTARIVSELEVPNYGRAAPYPPMEAVHGIEFESPPEWAKDGDWQAAPWQLEPIVPEGWALSTWAECAWQPEHLREKASKAGAQ